jgi:hypothetical protein
VKIWQRYLLAGFAFLGMLANPFAQTAELPGKAVDFIHDVQPILKESCYSCHGPEKSKGGLRLDVKARALKGGENGPVIVPGSSAKSPLIARLSSADPDERMPQKAEPFSREKIKRIADWIDRGAIWPEAIAGADPARHWAFQPLNKPQPPTVKNSQWVRASIDNFVLAQLEAHNLKPNGPADRRKLIRRAYLDLLGLPPTPVEVEAFVGDASPKAYDQLIDRLLANPHYGERWARHWLDAARFAESDGFEQDTDRPYAYWYRDFVIKALNDDLPYDQFVEWQIAGDELAPDDPWAMAATGFLGAEQFPTQLTEAEFEQARYDELDNMAATTGTAILGLTIGCARCHDHKFDPISNKEYYRLVSTFTTTIRSVIDLEFDRPQSERLKTKFEAEHAPLVDARDRFEKEQLPARFARWLSQHPERDAPNIGYIILDQCELRSKGGATFTRQEDGSFLASGTNADFDTYTCTARTRLEHITGVRIEALAHPSFVKGGPGRADNGNFDLTDLRVTVAPTDGTARPAEVKLVHPKSTFDQGPHLAVALAIDDDKHSGWAIDPQFGKDHAASFEFEKPIGFAGETELTITLDFQGNNRHNIGRPRISITADPVPLAPTGEGQAQNLVEIFTKLQTLGGATNLTTAQTATLAKWYQARDPEWRKLDGAEQDHLKQAPKPNLQKVMVTSEGFQPIPHFADERGFPHFYPATYFLKRGDARQKGEVATPGFLEILDRAPEHERHWQQEPPAGGKTSYRRRGLGHWLVDTQCGAGQLTARVIVNRLWQHHFGRGIVATPNDFGLQGERPTHPELLDWLANDLIAHGWQLKRLHKLIMTSATYIQSAEFDEGRAQMDRENRLLWHWPRQRLEAEAIRDSMLSVSKELDPTLFGPGSLDPNMRRRSIYFFIKRSQLIPILMLFDFPEPNVSVGARVSTTIAPQALAAMNSPQVRNYARAFARRLNATGEKPLVELVTEAYRLALGRGPDKSELENAVQFIQRQRPTYQGPNQPIAAELALADFCQVLFALSEFIYVE